MRHAHYKLLPHRERARSRVPANFPAVYLQGRRRRRFVRPFNSPADIASLRLWLKADALALTDNSPVGLWPDSSGWGNDVGQNTGMKRPTFKAGMLTGLPVVRFDGIDDTLFNASSKGFACAQGHTVIAMLNPTTAVSYGMAVVTHFQDNEMRQSPGGGYAEWMIPSGLYQVDSGFSLEATWSVWTGTYDVASQTLELFINGGTQGTTVDAGPLAVGGIYIGSRTDTYHWLGDMAEVLVFDAALPATDRQHVENYLLNKYEL